MKPGWRTSFLICLLGPPGSMVPDGPPADASARIENARRAVAATQLSMRVDDPRGEVRFRGTVVGRDRDGLLILTAAHCFEPDDRGRKVELAGEARGARATVVSVTRNPAYPRDPKWSLPGADNALVALKVDDESPVQSALFLESLSVAQLTRRPIPPPGGGPATAFVIDQFQHPHAVRAGNFDNPRWLAWGKAYEPIPGDSGSGVFIFLESREGRAVPVLIGTVTDRNPQGGGASLISVRDSWVAGVLGGEVAKIRAEEGR